MPCRLLMHRPQPVAPLIIPHAGLGPHLELAAALVGVADEDWLLQDGWWVRGDAGGTGGERELDKGSNKLQQAGPCVWAQDDIASRLHL
jgi:hypothetical protein